MAMTCSSNDSNNFLKKSLCLKSSFCLIPLGCTAIGQIPTTEPNKKKRKEEKKLDKVESCFPNFQETGKLLREIRDKIAVFNNNFLTF